MKTNLYLLLILLSISTLSFAQKTLQAINKTTGEVIVIKEYNIVKFYSKSGVFKGEMRFLDTSSILVKDAYFTLALTRPLSIHQINIRLTGRLVLA
jgi:hypothetical protein